MAVYGNGYTHWHINAGSNQPVKQSHRGGNKRHDHLPSHRLWANSKLELEVFQVLEYKEIPYEIQPGQSGHHWDAKVQVGTHWVWVYINGCYFHGCIFPEGLTVCRKGSTRQDEFQRILGQKYGGELGAWYREDEKYDEDEKVFWGKWDKLRSGGAVRKADAQLLYSSPRVGLRSDEKRWQNTYGQMRSRKFTCIIWEHEWKLMGAEWCIEKVTNMKEWAYRDTNDPFIL